MGQALGILDDGSIVHAKSPSAKISIAITALAGGVANIAALTALSLTAPSTISDGAHVWVESVRDWFVLRTSAASLASGVVVSSSVAGRLWFRCLIPDPTWALQTVWELNSASSVENDGLTPGTAVPWSEMRRRLAGAGVNIAVSTPTPLVININGDLAATDPMVGKFHLISGGCVISGVPTAQFSGTVSGSGKVDGSTTGTGTTARITSTWTPATEVGRLVYDSTNARYSWVARDMGSSQAKVANWLAINESAGGILTSAGLSNTTTGASIVTYTLPQVLSQAQIFVQRNSGTGIPFVINKLKFAVQSQFYSEGMQPYLQNCDLSLSNHRFQAGVFNLNNCWSGMTQPDTNYSMNMSVAGGVWAGTWANGSRPAAATVTFGGLVLFQAATFTANRNMFVSFVSAFFEDCTTDCITALRGATIQAAAGIIRGTGNTAFALRVASGSRVYLAPADTWAGVFGLATAGGSFQLGSTPSLFTTAVPQDVTGAYGAAISTTWANMDASFAGGGFGGRLLHIETGSVLEKA